MKASEKAKAQKVVDKIQAGTFDENDIDNLFMKLRAYSGGFRDFLEIAHFVAHNDDRNQGLINESMESFFLSFKFYLEYGYRGKPLDIYAPMPLYIKKLMKYQIDKCDPSRLREMFNVTREKLKSRIESYFKDDKRKNITQYQRAKPLHEKSLAPIEHILGFIGSKTEFTGASLISDLLGTLKLNKLQFDEALIRGQQSAILICVMLLMHQTKYNFEGDAPGICLISAASNVIVEGMTMEMIDQTLGELEITGMISCALPEGEGQILRAAFPIFKSGLRAVSYCDKSLFSSKPILEAHDWPSLELNFDQHLVLTAEGKLGLPS